MADNHLEYGYLEEGESIGEHFTEDPVSIVSEAVLVCTRVGGKGGQSDREHH